MIINQKTIILFRVVVHPNITIVHTENTETGKRCHHYIANGHDGSHTIAYIFGGTDCKDKLFVGYGCHDWDSLVLNYIISYYRMGINPTSIYTHMQQDVEETENEELFKYFFSVDMKKILLPEKQRLSLWQVAFKLGMDVPEYIPYNDAVKECEVPNVVQDNTELNIILAVLENIKDKIALRFDLLNRFKVNAINVDDTLLGIRFITRKYLDKTKEKFSEFISKRTQPSYFKVSRFVKTDKTLENKVLRDFIEKSMDKAINPLNSGKKAWSEELLLPRLKLSVGSGGIRSINTPERFVCKDGEKIIYYDFTSMFPTVMCNYSLFSRHLSQDFHELYNLFRLERIKAKKAGNKDRSNFLKTVINAAIGLMNSDWSYMYDPVMNSAIRIQSMFIMIELIDLLLPKVKRVIQVNVDGIFVMIDSSKENSIDKDVDSFMEEKKMSYVKTDYCKMFQASVNDYLCERNNGDVEARGLFSTNEYSKSLKPAIVVEAIQRNLLYGDDVRDTVLKCQDLNKFLMSTNIANRFIVKCGKQTCRNSVRFYYAKGFCYCLTRNADGKQAIIDQNGVVVVDSTASIDKERINYTPYFGMANKVVMQFKQLLLFTLIRKKNNQHQSLTLKTQTK